MATEKILNTRIINKNDSYEKWSTSSLTLKEGEIALAYVNTQKPDGHGGYYTVPTYLMKIGVEGKTFQECEWLTAPASDVYEWAKLQDPTIEQLPDKLKTAIKNLQSAVGDGGSVAESIANAIKALDSDTPTGTGTIVKSVVQTDGKVSITMGTLSVDEIPMLGIDKITGLQDALNAKQPQGDYATKTEAQGYADAKDEAIAAAKKAGDDAQADVDTLEGNVGSVDGLSTTSKTVVGAINEVLAAVGTGGTAAVVTITTDTTTEGALKSYTVKQGTTTVGVIDIPKDMVVQSGSVVSNPEGQPEGTYIKLILANATNDEIYVNVGTLVDIYKAQANATQVQIAIDSATREISATIVAGSIDTTELADNAVVTAKIADANITKAKLSTDVQASLALADSALQSHQDISGKADKVSGATTGNFAGLDATGNLTDSGKKASDFATAAQGILAETAIQNIYTEDDGNPLSAFTASEGDNKYWVITVKDKSIITKFIADNAVGAKQLKSDKEYSGDDAEIWVFDCGDSTNV